MKKWFLMGGAFIALYIFFVLWLLPVSQVVNRLELPRSIFIENPTGTLWQGKATNVFYKKQKIEQVNWSLNWLSLLTFNPSYTLTFGNDFSAGPRGQTNVSDLFGAPTLSDGQIFIDSSSIVSQLNFPIDVTSKGDIELTYTELKQGTPICEVAQGNLNWQKASLSAFEQNVQVGDLSAEIACKDGKLAIKLGQPNNLGITFTAFVNKNYRLTGTGYMKPGGKFPKELEQLLGFLPKPDNKGRYKLKL